MGCVVVMTLRPEAPEEYDRRKCAEIGDFDPSCDVNGCVQNGTQGARCRECGSVRFVMCGAHAGVSERNLRLKPRPSRCGECGAEGLAYQLVEFRPLAGWFS